MRTPIATALLVLALAPPCGAKNHLWRFTEFFSNADGTVQFIEMQECCGSDVETQMASTFIASNANTYTFPNNLVGPTAHKWILIATQAFTDLPGAPTPDYIIPAHFFDPDGDTLRYRGTTDLVDLSAGALPRDGRHSLDRNLQTGTLTVIVNAPINFAGETGSVTVSPIPIVGPLCWIGLAGSLAAIGLRRLLSATVPTDLAPGSIRRGAEFRARGHRR